METDQLKWIVIGVLGTVTILSGTFLAYTSMKQPIMTDASGTIEKTEQKNLPSDSSAINTVQETSTYQTLDSSMAKSANNTVITLEQVDAEFFNRTDITFQDVRDRYNSDSLSDSKYIGGLMIYEGEFAPERSKVVLSRFGTSAGYIYQVNVDGEVINSIAAQEFKQIAESSDLSPQLMRDAQGDTAGTASG